MRKDINIAKSELPIMKLLWEGGELSSTEIISKLDANPSTVKTLLKRLVDKDLVAIKPVTSRSYLYYAILSEDEYIAYERKGFLSRVFDGSKTRMLLNFVKEENITKQDIESLLRMIEEGEDD